MSEGKKECEFLDEAILAQEKAIDDEVQATQPLISAPISLEDLMIKYYAEQPLYQKQLKQLMAESYGYTRIRKIRGDGNCFYRAFLFEYLANCINNSGGETVKKAIQRIHDSKTTLISLGYIEVAIDIFWEAFLDYLKEIQREEKSYEQFELDFMNENGESNYLVWYCRLLTSGFIKQNPERFQPFIDGMYPGYTIEQFCAAEIEPMGKECEQIQVIALTEVLNVRVKIAYLDGRVGSSSQQVVQIHEFGCAEEGKADIDGIITLLYRPGHYDILYQE